MLVASCIPMVLSAVVLGAHFLRSGHLPLVVLCLAMPFVLFVRHVWALRLVQLFLIIGTAEWVRSLIEMVRVRQTQGEPWTRLVIILGGVATFTAASALILQSRRVRAHFDAAGRGASTGI